ncbi:MAG TPA: NAD(P)H-binding protein [Thermoplasmatales archaeon]|nr:NAD(P)H-binding protein [Thermoplasmatales archaeon]
MIPIEKKDRIYDRDERYSRQIILKEIGKKGQRKLFNSRVVIIGCGALGSTIANNLVRIGIGFVRIVDRDLVELSNLQRQNLYDERDIGLPKASAATDKLRCINADVEIEAVIEDVTAKNIEKIIGDMDIVLDGTDNMLTRFLINDACIKHDIPWIYGGAVGTQGMSMNILPSKTPCFRCILPNLPKAGSLPTCDTLGVLNSIPTVIASIETTEAIKILLDKNNFNRHLIVYDIWTHEFHSKNIKKNESCECCVKHNFQFLKSELKTSIIKLCGTDGFQITPASSNKISFKELKQELESIGEVSIDEVLLKFKIKNYEINIFRNGRAIIYGAEDEKTAKSLYARYIGL